MSFKFKYIIYGIFLIFSILIIIAADIFFTVMELLSSITSFFFKLIKKKGEKKYER